MRTNKLLIPFVLLVLAMFAASCNTGEGSGGTGSIEGTVYKVLHPDDNYNLQTDTVFSAKLAVGTDYTFNPKTYLRTRLSVSYAIPQTRLKLHFSEEFWWCLYKPGNNIIDQMRTVLGLQYGIDRHHTLDFYLRYDNVVQVRNLEHVLYFGVAYSFE